MKYGLLEYSESRNFGDEIQSLAALQYLPRVDKYIDRDHMYRQADEEEIKVIMNGWFMREPENWPPPPNIIPLFVSFHITHDNNCQEILLSKKSIEYLKKHEPIGCRDYHTVKTLEERGVKAYYTGCLTLTLPNKYQHLPKTEDIYMVDVMYKMYKLEKLKRIQLTKKIIPKEILQKAIFVEQDVPHGTSQKEKFSIAEEMLQKYATAKLVITSRIHCALPCIALGTPVLFVNGSLKQATDTTRLNGIIQYMNSFDIHQLEVGYQGSLIELLRKGSFLNPTGLNWENPKPNPNTHLEVVENLRKKVLSFIEE